MHNPHSVTGSCSADYRGALLCIAGHGGEVQFVLGSEDHVLGANLQDGGRLQGGGDGEQGQLRWGLNPIRARLALPVQEFESSLKIKGLGGREEE